MGVCKGRDRGVGMKRVVRGEQRGERTIKPKARSEIACPTEPRATSPVPEVPPASGKEEQ